MFQFSDKHIEEYETLGYTVFRNILPATLVNDLRRQCDTGTARTREKNSANAQRFQPVASYVDDVQPFVEFQNLDVIRDAVGRIVPGPWQASGPDMMGVLIEPGEEAWCTQWHRDWRDNVPGIELDHWVREQNNRLLFNQVNCALYEDSCTWVVPGSHVRPDTDGEIRRFPSRPIPGVDLTGLSGAQREYACLQYCESLPGAQRLLLDAGDYCLYRNSLWHLGNYLPYRKRATLHDNIMTPEFRNWWDTVPATAGKRREQGLMHENPNAERVKELALA